MNDETILADDTLVIENDNTIIQDENIAVPPPPMPLS